MTDNGTSAMLIDIAQHSSAPETPGQQSSSTLSSAVQSGVKAAAVSQSDDIVQELVAMMQTNDENWYTTKFGASKPKTLNASDSAVAGVPAQPTLQVDAPADIAPAQSPSNPSVLL